MLEPGVIGPLLHPENAIVVSIGGEQVRQTVFIQVDHEDETRGAQIEVGMELPVAVSWVGRSFQPAFRSDDVVSPVAVYVARSDAVPVILRPDDVQIGSALL